MGRQKGWCVMSIIKVCPICGKIDVSEKHIKDCEKTDRQVEQDIYWK